MSADSSSASRCPFLTLLPWPAYNLTILPSLTGPMIAVRSSGTRIFPLATTTPAIGPAETISVSIALSEADWAVALDGPGVGEAEEVAVPRQAPHNDAAAITVINTILCSAISEILSRSLTCSAALRLRAQDRAARTGSRRESGKSWQVFRGACESPTAIQESCSPRPSSNTLSGFECC